MKQNNNKNTSNSNNDQEFLRSMPKHGPGSSRPRVSLRSFKGSGKTLNHLLSYIVGNQKPRLLLAFILILISVIANVAGSMFIQILIDNYISPLLLQDAPVFSGLLKAICTLAFIFLVGVLSSLAYSRTMVTISQGVLKRVRDDMFTQMQSLPIKYFDSNSYGDLMSRYTNDTDTLRQMISQSIPQAVSSAATIIAVFIAMISLSIWLTLVVLAFVFVMLFVSKKISSKSSSYFVKQQKSLGSVNGFVEEVVNGQKVVKVFCREQQCKIDFDEKNDVLCENAAKAYSHSNIIGPVMGNIGNLQYVIVAIVGGALAIGGGFEALTLGAIASFLTLCRNFSMPINQISEQISAIVMALAGANRIFNLIDEKPECDEGNVTLVNARYENGELTETEHRTGIWAWKSPQTDGTVKYTELKGDVHFSNVDFGYNKDKTVLHDVSLFAKPGQKIAFVGATGAGKTTITNLINRFYDISKGQIYYDGIDIKDIKKYDLRRSLGMVLQDTNLFTGTVMENIRYGKLDASDEDVIEAAKLANAHGFITRLPEGYNTIIDGNGASLSQGQRQLLAIARAAVANPPVMILDEATSSIDTRTERLVQKGMDRLMNGRTVFVIAHRLSTIQNSEAILVLEDGRIIERGDHETLLSQQGKYHELYTGSFKLA